MTEITSVAGESDATIKTAEAYLADLLRIPFCSLCCEMAVQVHIPLVYIWLEHHPLLSKP